MFTSGSTGQPKGVMVTHANVSRLFPATAQLYRFQPADVWASTHSFAFDFSVWELWGALLHGASVIVVPAAVARSPLALVALLAAHQVTILSQTPSALQGLIALLERKLPAVDELRLRHVVLGAEPVRLATLQTWFERYRDGAPQLVNMYGITETTVHVTAYPLSAADLAGGRAADPATPIGTGLADLRLHVLDAGLRPVAIGIPGELYVGGAGVSLGYIGQPDLTAARFIADPVGPPGERLYRTGDRVRWTNHGGLEFLGRADDQLQIRGYRVEPAEVEAALLRLPHIRSAAVGALPDPVGPGERLTAWLVLDDAATIEPASLRDTLSRALPRHLLPDHYITLAELPHTLSGKLDRRALLEAAGVPLRPAAELEAPSTPTEEHVARIWTRVLAVPSISRLHDFFELGGHSLLAVQVINRLAADTGLEVPLRTLFEHPVLADFAARLDRDRPTATAAPEPVTPVERTDDLPLSFGQQRLWFLHQLEPDSLEYTMPLALDLTGPLDVAALAAALTTIVERHEVLRTTFDVANGEPVQRIHRPEPVELPVRQVADDAAADTHLAELASRPFNLASGPMLRAALLRLHATEHRLVLVLHHIVADLVSTEILHRELAVAYQAHRNGKTPALAPLPVQYADYASWQRRHLTGDRLHRQLGYWRRQLAAVPALQLPTDRVRTSNRTADADVVVFAVDPTAALGVRDLATQTGTTQFTVLLAATQVVLARYCRQTDIAVGIPVSGRTGSHLEHLVGFFVNTLVLRTDLVGAPTFAELVGRTSRSAVDAYANQDVPFEYLVDQLAVERDLSRHPLFDIMVSYQHDGDPALALADVDSCPVPTPTRATIVDLAINLMQHGDELHGAIEYRTDLFDRDRIEAMAEHLQLILQAAVEDPDRPIAALPATEPRPPVADDPAPPTPQPGPATDAAGPSQRTVHALTDIWLHLLGATRLGSDDNFFHLGGHSLLATRLISTVNNTFEVDLPLRVVFEQPSLRGLATAIDTARRATADPVTPADRRHALPLSFAQQRLWLLHQLEPASTEYHVPVALRLDGPVDVTALAHALTATVERHEILRTTFSGVDTGDPVQRIHPPTPVPLPRLSACDDEEADRLIGELTNEPFDLASGPLLRARLIELPDRDALFALVLHHAICDQWSVSLLTDELMTRYRHRQSGTDSGLSPLELQYADYAAWQRRHLTGRRLTEELDYWRGRLAGIQPLQLPTDHPRRPDRDPHGALVSGTVDEPTTARLREIAQDRGATLFMLLLAAFQAHLADLCHQDDIAVGTPVAGRTRTETNPLIGLFVNTLVLRSDLSGDPTFLTLLDRVRDSALDAYAHQEAPFETVVDALNPDRDLSRSPLFDVMFSYEEADLTAGAEACTEHPVRLETTPFDLTLAVTSDSRGLRLGVEYRTDLFTGERIERLAEHFQDVLRAVAADSDRRLSALPRSPDRRLEAPPMPQAAPAPVPAAPQTPTELALANIWRDLLDLDSPLSRHQTFFDAGGHSLLATQMLNRINAIFRVAVPLRAVFEHPALADLARVIDTLHWLDDGAAGPAIDGDYEEVDL